MLLLNDERKTELQGKWFSASFSSGEGGGGRHTATSESQGPRWLCPLTWALQCLSSLSRVIGEIIFPLHRAEAPSIEGLR